MFHRTNGIRSRALKRKALAGTVISLLALISVYVVFAAVSLSTSIPYTQNFDGIGTAGTAPLPANWKVDKQTSSVRTVGTYTSATLFTNFVGGANLSSSASNGIYNFGSGSDRSIGFLASGSGTASGNLYAQLVNNSGGNLSGLQISYNVEKYRNGSNPQGFRFQMYYSTNGATWTDAGSDFLTSFPADANNNGFNPAPGATVPVTNKVLNVSVASGANIYLAWNYSVTSGSTVTNAQALAIDDVSILGIAAGTSTSPSGTGAANPNSVASGGSTLLTVSVTPGSNPTSSGLAVSADLSSIGGSATQQFFDDQTHGDATAGDNIFSFSATVANGTSGAKTLPFSITDAQGRSGTGSISLTVQSPPPPADHVVISQLYGGGGNSGAPFTTDYIELYNPTGVSFDLAGWSLQYASATGTSWTNKQPLGGTIAPGEYFLVSLASGLTGSPLPVLPNISGDINMSATTGKVALVNNSNSLSGACPFGSDPDIVDFVGYGTSANCFEGAASAAAPSNSTALFRKLDGSQDTNQNGSDFVTGAPNPRRTSPIVELGPWVADTEPIADGTNAPYDSTVSIDFSEPVDVVGSWYDITCTNTGKHNSATVASYDGFKGYHITPNTSFQFGEQCTVTIFKDQVHDQDLDDAVPNTDTLFADYIFTFNVVAAGAPAPYPPSVHLTMGNPSNAIADPLQPNNYLMEKPTYALSYNRDNGTPNWVSWHLDQSWSGTLTRVDTFRADPAVLPDWYRVQSTDYSFSGFDRGHMTPNADRDNENRIPINQETYLMSNMVPQSPDNNQGPWASFENYLRSILPLNGEQELYIVSGPLGVGGSGSNGGTTNTIAGGHVKVPAYTWKVVLVLPKGDDDVSRVTAGTRTIAVLMPNVQGIRNNPWENYLTTVDAIEALTGYDFFPNVPDAIENAIEAGTNGLNPPGTEGQAVTTAEDTPKNITLTAVGSNGPLTYTIVNPPAHGNLTGSAENRTFNPDPNFNGPDSFTFKVSDGNGDSNISTINITVTDVNDPPTATDDSKGATEDTELNFLASDLAANDSAGPANESTQNLTVMAVGATADTHGSVSLNGGTITYTPAANFNGAASFTYTVCDNGTTGGASDPQCTTGTVNVTVDSVNDAPTLNPIGNYTVYLGNTLNFTVVGSDIDLPPQMLSYSLTGAVPAGASINPASGLFSWTPTAAQAGHIYTFGVSVTDDGSPNLSAGQPVSIAVAYTWSGLLAPIQPNGVYKAGRTIPLRFQLTGPSAAVTDAVIVLRMFSVTNNQVGDPVDVQSTSSATSGNLFRCDASGSQYIFNLDTSGLAAGTYQVQVDMGDGVLRVINISLR